MRLDITNLAMPEPEAVTLLKAEVRRLRAALSSLADQGATPSVREGTVIVTKAATLTDEEREAVEGAIEAEHRRGAWKWAETLRGLLERMLDTPAANATPSEGFEQSGCTLTAEEREAVEWCVEMALNSATDCVAEINTLRFLLERL